MKLLLMLLFVSFFILSGIAKDPVNYVNPFIGTSNSLRPSIWEANGGAYPGAALPFGMVQATPDDYHYDQKYIKSFTVINHTHGYPKGSSGSFHIMPFTGNNPEINMPGSAFSHDKETATPGYYAIFLEDYRINAEMTLTEYSAFFRFDFRGTGEPGIVIDGISEPQLDKDGNVTGKCDGYFFTLKISDQNTNIKIQNSKVIIRSENIKGGEVMLKIGFSVNSIEKSASNLQNSIGDRSFDQVRKNAADIWNTHLSRIMVEGDNEKDKVIFYTALYHSLLDPHLISDFGMPKRYTDLSPWDTFKSKQPLITLLEKSRQSDMIKSLLDQFDRSGMLDAGPMTGVHNVPIIVDSYFKNSTDFDVAKSYKAMEKSLLIPPFGRENIDHYIAHQYVPAEIGYSVTKTLEYAYDYWAMAQMAKALNKSDDYKVCIDRSTWYENIFNSDTKFMTAKSTAGTWQKGGYREGDKWAYNWTPVHDIRGLINLAGGKKEFVAILDSCFLGGNYFHDNEPLLHNSYLYCYAGEPWKTQQAVRKIMELDYSATPGGLSGNDDLGALSAWYVFSAMGFFPVCPGTTQYVIGSPIFRKVTITPDGGKPFVINAGKASVKNKYIQSASLNGKNYSNLWISHDQLMAGGELRFAMGENPMKTAVKDAGLPASETKTRPEFKIEDWDVSKNSVEANEEINVKVKIQNKGKASGSFPVNVYLNDTLSTSKWFRIKGGESVTAVVPIKLYRSGDYKCSVNHLPSQEIKVKSSGVAAYVYANFTIPLPPVVKENSLVRLKANVKNIGSFRASEGVKLYQNGELIDQITVTLNPGEGKEVVFNHKFDNEGLCTLRIGDVKEEKLLVYGPRFSVDQVYGKKIKPIMAFDFDEAGTKKIKDHSDLKNDALVHGAVEWVDGLFGKAIKTDATKGAYIEIPDHIGYKGIADGKIMTTLLWIYPIDERNFADIITKGDLNVIQVRASNTEVNYYSGGPDRGEAYTLLPLNWNRNWHHLAAVSDGQTLTLYIDGKLMIKKELDDKRNLTGTTTFPWNIGRNAENTERKFNGYIDHVMVFDQPLSEKEINEFMLWQKD